MSSTFSICQETLNTILHEALDRRECNTLKVLGNGKGLSRLLNVDPIMGLSDSSDLKATRKALFGENVLPPPPSITFWKWVLDSLGDNTLRLLILASALSLVITMLLDFHIKFPVSWISLDFQQVGESNSGWVEGGSILTSVIIVVLITSWNNYHKEKEFEKLDTISNPSPFVQVRRDGKETLISTSSLLVGDILYLSAGMVVPVDGVLCSCSDIAVDESSITGESNEIYKSAAESPVICSGSSVTEGEGWMLVTAVGINAFSSQMILKMRYSKPLTPLQERLTKLADNIGKIGMVVAMVVGVSMLFSNSSQRDFEKRGKLDMFFQALTTAITIVVVAVPEGLPLSVTVSLAYSMRKMFSESILVRHLAACETMGGVTVICTDKTGTLTHNNMCVRAVLWGTTSTDCWELSSATEKRSTSPQSSSNSSSSPRFMEWLPLWSEAIAVNSSLQLISNPSLDDEFNPINKEPGWSKLTDESHLSSEKISWYIRGSKTEGALFSFLARFNYNDFLKYRSVLEKGNYHTYPFSSYTKCMVTAIYLGKPFSTFPTHAICEGTTQASEDTSNKTPTSENLGIVRYFVKGAAEQILENCTTVSIGCFSLTSDEKWDSIQTTSLTSSRREEIDYWIQHHSKRGLRILAVAYCDVPVNNLSEDIFGKGDEWKVSPPPWPSRRVTSSSPRNVHCQHEGLPFSRKPPLLNELTLLGMFAMEDPLREGVWEAVNTCHTAGVHVCMVTGDSKATAISIAKSSGIYGNVISAGAGIGKMGIALHGKELRHLLELDEEYFCREILPKLQILARATPLDKELLVSAFLRNSKDVIAVTGDGTNDALALKKAHIGLAMNSGTDVCKCAADIVVLSNDFCSISTAILWGRNVYDNILKFIQFQMTINLAALVITTIGVLSPIYRIAPFSPSQLLWVNMIMDTMAALALATERPSLQLLKRPPRKLRAENKSSIISSRMWLHIIGQGLYQVIVQLLFLREEGAIYFGVVPYSVTHKTMLFNMFVFMQILNEFNARVIDEGQWVIHLNTGFREGLSHLFESIFMIVEGFSRAPYFLMILLLTVIIQILMVCFGGAWFNMVSLSTDQWLQCLIWAWVPIPLGILLRLIPWFDNSSFMQYSSTTSEDDTQVTEVS